MNPVKISQFTERNAVEVSSIHHRSCGPLVTLMQSAGSMNFQFDMTPDQARALAIALVQHANALEA